MKVTRKQIAKVFIEAKKRLAKDKKSISYYSGFDNEYICIAIEDIEYIKNINTHNARTDAAKEVIMSRLGLNESDMQHDVDTYVRDVLHIPKWLITGDNLQAYRHAWLNALIAEFSK